MKVYLFPDFFAVDLGVFWRQQSSPQDLYWTTGDGGPQTDYENHSQDLDTMLGAIMRITVPSSGEGYTVPSGNYGQGIGASFAQCIFFVKACQGGCDVCYLSRFVLVVN